MATTAADQRLERGLAAQHPHKDTVSVQDSAKGGSWKGLLIGVGLILGLGLFWRGYQQLFAFSKGLDATNPDYDKYWMSMLYGNLIVIPTLSLLWYGYLAKGCAVCREQRAERGEVTSRHETGHIWRLWSLIGVWLLAIFFAGSFQAEQDATWHQVVTRDTAFTPSHIMLFYGSFPAAIGISVGIFLYARTRLPHIFRDRGFPLSFGLLLTGTFFLLFWVAANEFLHSFFFTEEIFSAPLHWGFNLFAYLLAGTFAVWFQTAPRLFELADREAAEKAAAESKASLLAGT